jgi:hypothetical protein
MGRIGGANLGGFSLIDIFSFNGPGMRSMGKGGGKHDAHRLLAIIARYG